MKFQRLFRSLAWFYRSVGAVVIIALLIFTVFFNPMKSRTGNDSGKLVLRFQTLASPALKKTLEELITEYERRNPDVHIKLETFTRGYYEKLVFEFVGGVPPDIVFLLDTLFLPFAEKEQLLELDTFIENTPELLIDDIHPVSLQAFRYNGRQYCLPNNFDCMVLAYNKDLFDEDGIAYPDETWDWKTFADAAIKLTKYDINGRVRRFGFGFTYSFEPWSPFVFQNGGEFFNVEGTKCLLDSPEAIEATQFVTDLVLKHKAAPNYGQSQEFGTSNSQLFQLGLVAMSPVTKSTAFQYYQQKLPFLWDVAPLPKGKQRATFGIVTGYAIARDSKHKQESWEFLRYLVSVEVQKVLTKEGVVFTPRNSIANSDLFFTPDIAPSNDRAFLDSREYARLLYCNPYVKNKKRLTIIENITEEIVVRKKAAAEVIRKTVRYANERFE